jgi:hypothetical protein
VQDIVQGRSWQRLPVEEVPLPILQPEVAAHLRLRAFNRLSREVKAVLDNYCGQLAAHFESTAEREGFAVRLLEGWMPRRPHVKRQVRRLATV